MKNLLLSSLGLLPLLGCSVKEATSERVEPTFIDVKLDTTAVGTAEAPLPFTASTVEMPVTLQTLDRSGQPYPLDGRLSLRVRTGDLDQDDAITVADGTWTGNVKFKNGFGPVRIWAVDDGAADPDRVPSQAAGVSGEVYFALPTIAEMQRHEDHETNNLEGEFAEIRVSDRTVIVTALDAAGMWVTDISDPVGSYNSLYVYTFSRPDESLQPGVRVTLLTGSNQEYLATTQLSFPTTSVEEGATYPIPEAVELTPDNACDDLAMEGLEGSRATIPNASVPDNFLDDPDLSDKFLNYDEWPVTVGGCTIYIVSSATAPNFYAPDYAGATLGSVSGMVKEIYGEWILVVIDESDIVTGAAGPRNRVYNHPKRRHPETR